MIREFLTGMPQNLRRVTSKSGFIPEIDGLRFLAIVPVVLLHFGERWLRVTPAEPGAGASVAEFLSHGHIGVYIFFAVSGFILAMPFAQSILNDEPPVSIGKYYLRRLTRLEPPYIIIMTLLFVVLLLMKHQDFLELLPHYAASLLYVHRIFYGTWTPINPPAWTLEIEVQFYLLAPFLAMGYFRIRRPVVRRTIMLALIAGKIIFYNLTTYVDPFYQTLPFSVEFFLLGIVMVDIFMVEWRNGIRRHWVFDVVSLASFCGLFVTWSWAKSIPFSFAFICCLFLTFYGSFRSVWFSRFLRNPWISAIGGMCYTIYLLHLAFAELFVAVFKSIVSFSYLPGLLVGLLLFLPSIFLLSSVFFILLEKPCMDPRWPEKLRMWWASKRNPRKVRG